MTSERSPLETRSPSDSWDAEGGWAVVAEDDDDSRALLISVLRRNGFEASEARNGNELVQRVEVLRREGCGALVVVSDISMPECDGVQAARRLRRFSLTLPIVLITASTDPDIWRAAVESGVNAILQKPIEPHELTRVVRDAMRVRHRSSVAPS